MLVEEIFREPETDTLAERDKVQVDAPGIPHDLKKLLQYAQTLFTKRNKDSPKERERERRNRERQRETERDKDKTIIQNTHKHEQETNTAEAKRKKTEAS